MAFQMLDLPKEIRLMIYKKVLVDSQYLIFLQGPEPFLWKFGADGVSSKSPECLTSQLLRTCKTIYDETLTILYGDNQFLFVATRNTLKPNHGSSQSASLDYVLDESPFQGQFDQIQNIILATQCEHEPFIVVTTPLVHFNKRIQKRELPLRTLALASPCSNNGASHCIEAMFKDLLHDGLVKQLVCGPVPDVSFAEEQFYWTIAGCNHLVRIFGKSTAVHGPSFGPAA